MTSTITIATRESRLALWQAHHVKQLLEAQGHQVSLLGMTTLGDQILDQPLSKVGGKGLFIKELEVALADGSAHIAVHSLKDVPMDLPQGFALACILEREDPRDAWVSPHFDSLESLPQGAVVGTSSLRRTVLLHALRPDLKIEPLRGNLDTRLRKLDEGQYAGIVLATAGLKRLGLAERIRHSFDLDRMMPAAGQGAIGIEICDDRPDLAALLTPLNDLPTAIRVYAERGVSRTMGGSCSMPLAAHATLEKGVLAISAAWGDPHNSHAPLIQAKDQCEIDLNHPTVLQQSSELGIRVAQQLIQKGAVAVIK
ncbi:hydroxymethylbilane synthase [Limnohabitans sp. 103DPR2]|jgi:hydroxymethylbilane synthase|uniref:hydroxymethylbilane synthase n=1 Tax=Limnohabitans sp. 103DPR2 TaxID=1678129 RepID=UPI0006DCE4B3|nr:hydroxymethylbilane synthase [Limnohabitans sp. 103DPR2]ALK91369.1 Porphobilinogen deaminase [Limnohabitans sp. 103DPR2]